MGLISRFFVASSCSIPFQVAWKRATHIDSGHPFDKSKLIEKLKSEAHPQSCATHVFTINVMECEDCGLIWFDKGLESR